MRSVLANSLLNDVDMNSTHLGMRGRLMIKVHAWGDAIVERSPNTMQYVKTFPNRTMESASYFWEKAQEYFSTLFSKKL